MISLVAPATITLALGLFMMLPAVRRRAAERGFSGSIVVPAIIGGLGLGLVCFGVGFVNL